MNIYGGKFGPIIPLVEPGYCALCKKGPDLSKEAVIDTLADIRGVLGDRPMPAPFAGRIYVCETCASVMASLIDFRGEQINKLLEEHNDAVALSVALEKELSRFDTLRELAGEIVGADAA